MSLVNRITKFAKSPQGKKVMTRAQELAKDPNTKKKIADMRARFASRPGGKPPAR